MQKQAKTSKLTPKRKKLIAELARTDNIAEAGRKAGFSPSSVRSTVYGLANDPFISAAVQKRRQRAIAHHQVTPEEVLGSATFQMRSSIRDVLDDSGSFSLEKADETGAIDLVKKLKETERKLYDGKGQHTETIKTVEVEMMTNQDGRKEVASYLGLDHFANSGKQNADITLMRELLYALVKFHNYSIEVAIAGVKEQFPHIDGEIIEIEAKELKGE